MIILTDEEAAKVRGLSPSYIYAALEPIPLKDGTWMLGEEVLDDPAHSDVRAFLDGLAKKAERDNVKYDTETKRDADAVALRVAGKTYRDAGTRANHG